VELVEFIAPNGESNALGVGVQRLPSGAGSVPARLAGELPDGPPLMPLEEAPVGTGGDLCGLPVVVQEFPPGAGAVPARAAGEAPDGPVAVELIKAAPTGGEVHRLGILIDALPAATAAAATRTPGIAPDGSVFMALVEGTVPVGHDLAGARVLIQSGPRWAGSSPASVPGELPDSTGVVELIELATAHGKVHRVPIVVEEFPSSAVTAEAWGQGVAQDAAVPGDLIKGRPAGHNLPGAPALVQQDPARAGFSPASLAGEFPDGTVPVQPVELLRCGGGEDSQKHSGQQKAGEGPLSYDQGSALPDHGASLAPG
jgi:hypothetical protein